MENTNNTGRKPIQESLDEYSQDSSRFNSSGANFGAGPSDQHLALNMSLTVGMFEPPKRTVTDVIQRRHEQKQQHMNYSRYNPKHPNYLSEATRISTYGLWPRQIKQTPQHLSNAGLFFTGHDDCVCCFSCGGKLRQWAYQDDPWIEHCRLFPLCPFAIEQRGEQFINQIISSDSDFEQEIFHHHSHTSDLNSSDLEEELLLERVTLEENRQIFLQMGYEDTDFRKAIIHLRSLGITEPTVDDFVGVMSPVIGDNSYIEDGDTFEMSLQENQFLKKKLFCVLCDRRIVGMLFLPCAHNKTCAECGNDLLKCPVCYHKVDEKIMTSLQDIK